MHVYKYAASTYHHIKFYGCAYLKVILIYLSIPLYNNIRMHYRAFDMLLMEHANFLFK